MRVLIIGCGRVGAATAAELDRRGENVTVVDTDQRAFLRLPPKFGGSTVRGSGTDEAMLREAGGEMADLLMALTEGDNRNALAAQMGKHLFRIPRVIAKINDPVRAEAYRSLGLETICRTVILSESLITAAVDGAEATNGAVEAPTAEPLHGPSPPGAKALVTADARNAAGASGNGGGDRDMRQDATPKDATAQDATAQDAAGDDQAEAD